MPPDCPTHERLQDYVAGDCALADVETVVNHLAACEACQRSVEALIEEQGDPVMSNSTQTAPRRSGPGAATPLDDGPTLENGGIPFPISPPTDLDAGQVALHPQVPAVPAEKPPALPIVGNYEVVRRISRGGQGIVYLARHREMKRLAALKVLPREYARDAGYLRRFRREAQAIARLKHPHIVTIYESGVAGGLHYISMEYVEGQSLAELLKKDITLTEPQIIEIAMSVGRGLHHAHENGILHRDVKPGNILITHTGEVKLTDFGLAKYETADQSFQTTQGDMLGTPAFISPEQARSGEEIDRRSDIYSLGCVVFNMAAGRPPFLGNNAFAILDQHRRAETPSVRLFNDQISVAMEALINRAMAKMPEQRYQNVQEMLHDFLLIQRALRAPETARGGLAQIVAALNQINVVARKIRAAQDESVSNTWRTRLIIGFLKRPVFWVAVAGAAALGCLILGIVIGMGL